MYHFVFGDACDNVKVSEGSGYTHTSSGDKVGKTQDATCHHERGGASFRRAMRDFPSGIIIHSENEAIISFHLFYCCSAAAEASVFSR